MKTAIGYEAMRQWLYRELNVTTQLDRYTVDMLMLVPLVRCVAECYGKAEIDVASDIRRMKLKEMEKVQFTSIRENKTKERV